MLTSHAQIVNFWCLIYRRCRIYCHLLAQHAGLSIWNHLMCTGIFSQAKVVSTEPFFKTEGKNIGLEKHPYTCGQGLNIHALLRSQVGLCTCSTGQCYSVRKLQSVICDWLIFSTGVTRGGGKKKKNGKQLHIPT